MITFDSYKLYLVGVLVALMYGLSPAVSALLFDTQVPGLAVYLGCFFLCATVFFLVAFPAKRFLVFKLEVSEGRLVVAYLLAAIAFVGLQIAYYGDFTTAFIVSYTDRAGTQMEGVIRYIFYPITTLFTTLTFLFAIYIYVEPRFRRWTNLLLMFASLFLIAALGSRNILLWCLSGVLAIKVSRMRFAGVFLIVPAFYLFAVFFAFIRNTGLLSVLLGTSEMAGELSWAYFDPNIHEFGSSYRTFEIIHSDSSAIDELANAPYGQVSSFFINQLPSFLKPADFVSFTEFISKLFAAPGEGIGSSPMTEALTSSFMSLAVLAVLAVVFFWPVYYMARRAAFRFTCICLWIALYLNIWRIGSAEVFKMYLSFVVLLFVVCPLSGVRFSTEAEYA